MKRHFLLLLLLLVGVAALHLSAQPADFEYTDCPFAVPEGYTIDCGYLSVPEDRTRTDSPMIRLAIAILRADNPAPDPIVYLEGGPGGSGIGSLDSWLDSPLLETRDIILLDQRGTGYSEPFLGCPEDIDPEDEAACRDAIVSEGINLGGYNSAESAADIHDLREALGYAEVNLLGISYGTRLALTAMRDYPQGIRSVILDSSFPPQVNGYDELAINGWRAFQQLFTDCAADSDCNAAYPDLENVFLEVIELGNEEPFMFDDGEGDTEYTGDDFANLLFDQMYDTTALPYLPRIIYEAAEGEFETVEALLAGEFYDEGFEDEDFGDDDADYSEYEEVWGLLDEYITEYLDFDDIDETYEYLDSLSDEDYYILLDEVIEWMSDEQFDDLVMAYLGFADTEEYFEYIDSLSDAEFETLLDDFYAVLYGEEGFVESLDSDVMYAAVTCREEIPFDSLTRAQAISEPLPDVFEFAMMPVIEEQFESCAIWNIPPAGSIEAETVQSDIPTLILAGNYDPITPPAWGLRAAEGLTRAYYYEFPGVGHSVIDVGECPVAMVAAFLDAPQRPPDSSCIADMTAPDFYID